MSDSESTFSDPVDESGQTNLSHFYQDQAAAWFEPLYAEARGDAQRIPWALLRPRPSFAEWLGRTHLQGLNPDGSSKSALVVACGLGDDAAELARRGFAITAFDISPTAIDWCRRRFPHLAERFVAADLFHTPRSWHAGFDFVLEIFTIQALPLYLRESAMAAIARHVAPGGHLLVIGMGVDEDAQRNGPPWPLIRSELALFHQFGLQLASMEDPNSDAAWRCMRAEFVRQP